MMRKQTKAKTRKNLSNKEYYKGKKKFRVKGKIKPITKKCRCGRRITHHHLFCNKCWDERGDQK